MKLVMQPAFSIMPKKQNWDLKRDVAAKLEKLEKRTQRAIAELIRAQAVECRARLSLFVAMRPLLAVRSLRVAHFPGSAGDQIGDEEDEDEDEDQADDESKLVQKVNRRQKADEVDEDSD